MSGAKKWPEVKPADGYRKTTTSDNAGPTAMKDVHVGGLDPLANPFLASGGTALESQKATLKKTTTVDKSKPVTKGEADHQAEKVL